MPQAFAADPDRLARFEREARLLAALNHPNIAHIHGLEESRGVLALVMELVEGDTLADRIARGPIPLPEALPIARQIAEALAAAHEQGIIHRDLKPATVKVRPDGSVKVLDFGLAKWTEPAAAADAMNSPTLSARSTQQGLILGTAAYMSPEQASGQRVDRRTDLWAFGCVLFEMLTAQRAFEGETVSHVIAAVLKQDPEWASLPDETPDAVRRLLRRTLNKDVAHRQTSARDAILDLDDARVPDPGSYALSNRPAPNPRSRLALYVWATAATVAALVLAARGSLLRPAPQTPAVVRLLLESTDKGTLDMLPAVSPDGRAIVYSWADPSGQTSLWLKSLDAIDARLFDGTAGARFPFWSPDGQYIGYWSDGMIRKVRVSDGSIQSICAASSMRGAAWSPRGTIIFAADSGNPLSQVAASGDGHPAPLTKFGPTEHSHRWPSFLPDGTHYFFTVRSTDPAMAGIHLGDLQSQQHQRLLPDVTNAVYVPAGPGPGHVLFARGGLLMAQAIDLATGRLVGEMVPMDRVGAKGGYSLSIFSASDSVLVYQQQTENQHLAWLDRNGKMVGDAKSYPTGFRKVSVSEDGRRVVLDQLDENTGVWNLWSVDILRGVATRLTLDPHASEVDPVWWPLGDRIAFVRDTHTIVVGEPGGANDTTLLTVPDGGVALDNWSPDGHFLVFHRRAAGKGALYALPMTGLTPGTPIRLSDDTAGDGVVGGAEISPDGRWIAYMSYASGRSEIFVERFSPGNRGVRQKISASGGVNPHWRHDSRELFYLSTDRTVMFAVSLSDGPSLDLAAPVALFKTPIAGSASRDFAVSGDGNRFLIDGAAPERAGRESSRSITRGQRRRQTCFRLQINGVGPFGRMSNE